MHYIKTINTIFIIKIVKWKLPSGRFKKKQVPQQVYGTVISKYWVPSTVWPMSAIKSRQFAMVARKWFKQKWNSRGLMAGRCQVSVYHVQVSREAKDHSFQRGQLNCHSWWTRNLRYLLLHIGRHQMSQRIVYEELASVLSHKSGMDWHLVKFCQDIQYHLQKWSEDSWR